MQSLASRASWRSRGASSRIPAKVARPVTPSGAERSSSKNGTRGRRPSLPRRPYTNASDALEKLRHPQAAGGGIGVVGGGDGVALLSPEYKAAGPHFAFHFSSRDQVQAEHARLQAAGVPVGELHDHRDGTASFYLQDPEGNWLELLYEPAAGMGSNRS